MIKVFLQKQKIAFDLSFFTMLHKKNHFFTVGSNSRVRIQTISLNAYPARVLEEFIVTGIRIGQLQDIA